MLKIDKIVLSKKNQFEYCYRGMLFFISFDKDLNEIEFKTTVFSEKDFIPQAICLCAEEVYKSSEYKKYASYLSIDKESFSVNLIQSFPASQKLSLMKLIRLSSFIARSWAITLKKVAERDSH